MCVLGNSVAFKTGNQEKNLRPMGNLSKYSVYSSRPKWKLGKLAASYEWTCPPETHPRWTPHREISLRQLTSLWHDGIFSISRVYCCVRIRTGIPLVYELSGEMKPIKHYYTASDAEVKAAIDKVANQGKAKWISAPPRSFSPPPRNFLNHFCILV